MSAFHTDQLNKESNKFSIDNLEKSKEKFSKPISSNPLRP